MTFIEWKEAVASEISCIPQDKHEEYFSSYASSYQINRELGKSQEDCVLALGEPTSVAADIMEKYASYIVSLAHKKEEVVEKAPIQEKFIEETVETVENETCCDQCENAEGTDTATYEEAVEEEKVEDTKPQEEEEEKEDTLLEKSADAVKDVAGDVASSLSSSLKSKARAETNRATTNLSNSIVRGVSNFVSGLFKK